MAKKFRIPGLSFSWKRAIGLTALRQKVARATGIPTTSGGRRRKFGPFGLFTLMGLFSNQSRQPVSQTSTDPATAAAGCLGCLVVGGVMMVASCAGLSYLGSLSQTMPPPKSNRDHSSGHFVYTKPLAENRKPHHVSSVQPHSLPAELQSEDLLPNPGESALETPKEKPKPAPRPVRTWTSADGQFSVEAEFISFGNGVVRLRRVDNAKELKLDEETLSAQDMAWIRSRFK